MGELRIRIEGELGTWNMENGSCTPGKLWNQAMSRGKRGEKRGMEWKQGKGEKGETGER